MNTKSVELSERERQILYLVAGGASNKEIALRLSISTNTVKVHLRNIFNKIEAKSRTEAAMYAVNIGLYSTSQSTEVESANKDLPSQNADAKVSGVQEVNKNKRILPILMAMAALVVIAVVVLRGLDNQKVYTVSGEASRWKMLPPMPTGRSGFAAAVYQKSIITIGGKSEDSITNAVEIFNLDSNTWSSGSSKPTPVSEVGAVVLAGKIYVPGGRLDANRVVNVLEIYDPLKNTWTSGAPIPKNICGYGITVFEGEMYLFGGWDGEAYSAEVYSYNPELNIWEEKSPMTSPRAYMGVGLVGRSIYLLGGYDGEKTLNLNETFQPDLEENNVNPWSQAGELPDRRFRMGVTSTTDMILLIGGMDENNESKKPIQYSPQLDEWVIFDNPKPGVWNDMSLVVFGTNLYASGGDWDQKSSDQFFAYQIYYTISFPVLPVQEP